MATIHYRDLKHFPEVYEEFISTLGSARRRAAGSADSDLGMSIGLLSSKIRTIGVLEYLMYGDIVSFRTNLSEAASLELNRFKRFEAGESIDASYVSMTAFPSIYDALAAGNLELARKLSAILGGRDAIEKRNDHPFDYAMGYLLKSFVDESGENEKRHRIEEFRKQCGNNFIGYLMVFEALMEDNPDMALDGFSKLISGHKRESKGRGIFAPKIDQLISIWGIGLANFSR